MAPQPKLSRDRLCRFAGVKRRTHLLWTSKRNGLLPDKKEWREVDLIRAAQLGAVWEALGPSRARAAWAHVRNDLPKFADFLELVYVESGERAQLAVSPEELAALIPRSEPVVVVDLAEPMRLAKEKYASFKERQTGAGASAERSAAAQLPRERAS